ncbi:HAMP domain-containing protein [Streptomyces sp. NPDC004457]|uniref:sensor histidine kinase n=1 Tax=Streptomyces spinosus TaxID=2872623 RepID=UPI001CEDF5EE|nr:HAMP domain-containing protein [Streptomyces spinosus]
MRPLASRARGTVVAGDLARRVVVASGLLVLLISLAFAILFRSSVDLRASQRLAQRSQDLLLAANQVRHSVVSLQTDLRGYERTGHTRFVKRWQAAQAALPKEIETLTRLADSAQRIRTEQVRHAGFAYVGKEYSMPLADVVNHLLRTKGPTAVGAELDRRVEAIRTECHRIVVTERTLAATREARAAAVADQAVVATIGSLTGSVVLVVGFAAYVTRGVVRPVRRAAAMAGRLAGGDLAARTPETGAGEIGVLERSFNRMAESLEESHAELSTSRSRILAAADQARRRIERDLHDGTQQRLVSLVLELRAAQNAVPVDQPELKARVVRVGETLLAALDDLRELARGIHPAILSEGGLPPALRALARRSLVPVELDVHVPRRLPEPVEVAAYYVVSEALANTAKHARASCVRVRAHAGDDVLRLSVHDDGVGGAVPGQGSGLVGLTDRVGALGGTLTLHSPSGHGTTLTARLPLT